MRLKVTVSYDGSSFDGWQKQKQGRTVQKTLEDALSVIEKCAVSIHGSGRTDAGVHALGQVFHFDSNLDIPMEGWVKGLNANLPDDIWIVRVEHVDDQFHARFDVLSKTYRYRLNMGPYDVFERNFVYQLGQPLNLDIMREARDILIGTHDFTSFNATPLTEIENQIRTITKLEIIESSNYVTFVFEGDGFLRYMVRMLVAVLVEVGRYRLPLNAIHYALEHPDKKSLHYNVPPHGLTLMHVDYELKQ